MADKVFAGEKVTSRNLKARLWNQFVESSDPSRLSTAGGIPGGILPNGVLLVRNDSGSDRDRFEVLGLGDPLYDTTDNEDEFKNNASFEGETPTADYVNKWAILQEPLPNGKIGRAMAIGASRVMLDINATGDSYAKLKASAYELDSTADASAAEAVIIWKESGTGTGKLAQIVFPISSAAAGGAAYIMKPPGGGIAAMTESGGTYTPGSATCTVYEIDGSGDLAATSDTETVYNLSYVAIGGGSDVFIHAKRDAFGKLLADFDPCGSP
jgi:hypothetical protein